MPGSYFTLALPAPIYHTDIISASPLWWIRAFISVTQTASEEKSVSIKANKCDLVLQCVTTSLPLPTPVSVFSWVMELVAECWLRNINESGQVLLSNLRLTLRAVFVLCPHYKWSGKCSWILQEYWDVAKVFGEQLGRDFSLVGSMLQSKHRIKKKKELNRKSAWPVCELNFVLFLELSLPFWFCWREGTVSAKIMPRLQCQKTGNHPDKRNWETKGSAPAGSCPFVVGVEDWLKPAAHPSLTVKVLSAQGKLIQCGWRNNQEWISVSMCLFMYFRSYFPC